MGFIFVTVGTHDQNFDRLLKKVDELKGSGKINEGIFAQTGNSSFVPKNFASKKFFSDSEFEEKMKTCSLVISHAGAGAIILALKHGKKLILAPRLKEFNEHTDSHQLDLAKFMVHKKKALLVTDMNELEKKIGEAKKFSFSAKTQKTRIVSALNDFFRIDL